MRYAIGHRHKEKVRDFGLMYSLGLVKDTIHAERRIEQLEQEFPDRLFFVVEIPDPPSARPNSRPVILRELNQSSDKPTKNS